MSDGLAELAGLLSVPRDHLEAAIAGPWSTGASGSSAWGEFTIFTGRENPRTPGRPLIAISVDHADLMLEIGHAVGVPLPDGRMRWALGEPRTTIPIDVDELLDWATASGGVAVSTTPEGLREAMLAGMRDAIAKVADTAMMRGISW